MRNKIKFILGGMYLMTSFFFLTPTTTVEAKPLYCLQAFVDCVENLPWYVHLGGGAAGCAIGYLGCG